MGAEEIRYAAPPQSRNESILAATINGTEYTDPPQSRIEDLLLQLKSVIESGAVTVDDVLSLTSTNPVQNKIITAALDGKQDALTERQMEAVNSGMTERATRTFFDLYVNLTYDPLNHNGIYRGLNLTGKYTVEQMYGMIHDGSFFDLFLGDYFTVPITTDIMTRFSGAEFESGVTYYEMGGGTDVTARTWTATEDTTPQIGKTYATKQAVNENVDLMFAAFDYYYNTGDTALSLHHAVLIPRNYGFATAAKMNSANTTEGGYYGSDMHQITLPCYAKSLKTVLGNHLLSHKTWLTTTVNTSTPSMAGAGMTGAASASAWKTTELQLMNEVQLYGSTVWSSSAYDVGVDNEKLPVFNFINPVHFGRNYFWLRSVVSSTNFANCNTYGTAGTSYASGASSVRPLILFG